MLETSLETSQTIEAAKQMCRNAQAAKEAAEALRASTEELMETSRVLSEQAKDAQQAAVKTAKQTR